MCDIPLPYVRHDSYLRVTKHLHTPHRCLRNCCVTGACAHTCDMTHPYVLSLCIPRTFFKCDTTHLCAQPCFAGSLTASVPLIAVMFSPERFHFLALAPVLQCDRIESHRTERWGAGVETQKNVRGEIGGWGRVPFNEPYAPSLITIYDGA